MIVYFSFLWDGYECCKGLRVFIIIRYYGFWFFKLEYGGGGGGYFVKLVKVINILI